MTPKLRKWNGKTVETCSMKLPDLHTEACFVKAALKTHALQTLRDCRVSPNRAKRLECVRFILILTQKNPCWTCIVNPLDLLDFQCFDGRGCPTGLPAKPATRLFTGLLGGFGCLAHGFLGKDERLQRRFPKAGCNTTAGAVHGGFTTLMPRIGTMNL